MKRSSVSARVVDVLAVLWFLGVITGLAAATFSMTTWLFRIVAACVAVFIGYHLWRFVLAISPRWRRVPG